MTATTQAPVSVEGIASLPDGATITITGPGGSTWTKQDGGWVTNRDHAPVQSAEFRHLARAGRVQINPPTTPAAAVSVGEPMPFEPGMLATDNANYWLILASEGDRALGVRWHTSGVFSMVEEFYHRSLRDQVTVVTNLDTVPASVREAKRVLDAMRGNEQVVGAQTITLGQNPRSDATHRAEVQRLTTTIASQEASIQRLTRIIDEVREGLDDQDESDVEWLDDILDSRGMGRATPMRTVRVSVTARPDVALTDLDDFLGNGWDIRSADLSGILEIEIRAESRGCACENIDLSDIEAHLRSEGISYDTVEDWEVQGCDAPTC